MKITTLKSFSVFFTILTVVSCTFFNRSQVSPKQVNSLSDFCKRIADSVTSSDKILGVYSYVKFKDDGKKSFDNVDEICLYKFPHNKTDSLIFKQIENADTFSFHDVKFNNREWKHISKSKGLKNLLIMSSDFDLNDLKHIATNKSIVRLVLVDVTIDDTSMLLLNKMDKLEFLIINNCKISDQGLRLLSQRSPLRYLKISNCKGVSEEGCLEFMKKNKTGEVVFNKKRFTFSESNRQVITPQQNINGQEVPIVKVDEDLEPYIGKIVQITGIVNQTKVPTIGRDSGWISCWVLDGYRDKTVQVTGVVSKRTETPFITDKHGNKKIIASRNGVFYHISGDSIKVIE